MESGNCTSCTPGIPGYPGIPGEKGEKGEAGLKGERGIFYMSIIYTLASFVHLKIKISQAIKVLLVPKENQEKLVSMDTQDPQVPKEKLELLVYREFQVLLG